MRVLVVVHGYPPTARGGSEVYAEAHARTLHDRYGDDVLVLTRDADPERPEFDVRETTHRGVRVVRINNTFRTVRSFEESYTQPRLAAIACALIDAFAPDVAHVHHLTCLSTLLPAHLTARGVPSFMTLHDYWLLCHRGQLLDRDCRACSSPGGCGTCLDAIASVAPVVGRAAALVRGLERHLPTAGRTALRAFGHAAVSSVSRGASGHDAAAARLAHMRDAASHISTFYAPSAHLLTTFARAGFPADRMRISPYGFETERLSRRAGSRTSGPLRIGFVGSLMVSKAPHLLLEAFRTLPAGAATLELFGAYVSYHGDDSYQAVLEPLLRTPGVTLHGWLPDTDMHRAYADIDVLVVPSVWPENSPLVLHEAFLAGVPVVASDIGGIPELVRHGENGLLVLPGDAGALRSALMRLLDEPALLPQLASHVTAVRTIEDDARDMRADYEDALSQRKGSAVMNASRVHAVVLNYRTPDQTLLAVRSLLASTLPLASVLVVDNSETVACGRMLAELSDRVDYLSTPDNLGYSGGMNVGIARALAAAATHVLLVNSDVTVPPDCCLRMLRTMADTPQAGIVGPTMLVRDTPDRIDSAGLSFDLGSGRMRMRRAGEALTDAAATACIVDAVSGCLMLIERQVFERVGTLDEGDFFGFEDVDFCLRARAKGFRTAVSSARAYHARAQSLPAHSPDRLYYATRNHLRLAASRQGGNAGVVRLGAVLALNLAHALKAPPSRMPARLRAVVAGAVDFFRGRVGARP